MESAECLRNGKPPRKSRIECPIVEENGGVSEGKTLKSRECFNFRDTGYCKFGAQCKLSHAGEEAVGRPRGACFAFRDTKTCEYGANCKFSHDLITEVKPKKPRQRRQRKKKPKGKCFQFEKDGTCEYGEKCLYLHDRKEKKSSQANNSTQSDRDWLQLAGVEGFVDLKKREQQSLVALRRDMRKLQPLNASAMRMLGFPASNERLMFGSGLRHICTI
jgi:hypothetical protein